MVELPGLGDSTGDASEQPVDEDPFVSCSFQDGTLHVYDDWIYIERPDRSKFDDKAIELADVWDVTYEKRLVISYLQIEQRGVEADEDSLLSTPVDENTLHFGRGKRDCAKRARDAIRDGADCW